MAVMNFLLLIISSLICIAFAFDPKPMQDFCVADLKSHVRSNAVPRPCKDPATVTPDDFYTSALNKMAGGDNNPLPFALTPVGVNQVPGLNTMGFSLARQDFKPNGSFPLHLHHRATELHIVLEGQLEVGFVSPDQNYRFYSKLLKKNDMFVVPMGLVHYQRNAWEGKTVAIAILNSQNPGVNSITHASFGSNPKIKTDYLVGAYQSNQEMINALLAKNWI